MPRHPAVRTRYPFRAVAFVAGASLLGLVNLVLMALFLMPMIPLIPLFVMAVVGNACLISAAVHHAASLAQVEPLRTARAERPGETLEAAHTEAPHAA